MHHRHMDSIVTLILKVIQEKPTLGQKKSQVSSDGIIISLTFSRIEIREPLSIKSYLPSATKYLIAALALGYICTSSKTINDCVLSQNGRSLYPGLLDNCSGTGDQPENLSSLSLANDHYTESCPIFSHYPT